MKNAPAAPAVKSTVKPSDKPANYKPATHVNGHSETPLVIASRVMQGSTHAGVYQGLHKVGEVLFGGW